MSSSNKPASHQPSDTFSGPGTENTVTQRDTAAPLEGIVVLDKPIGLTSMTAIAILRRKSGVKVGHAGTLDPLATGVLVAGLGKATKTLERFMKTRKVYLTDIDLSAFTSTDDREGERTEIQVPTAPDRSRIQEALEDRFTGTFHQTPPDFSAKKIDGRRAYATARKGMKPKLEPRPVHVHRISLLKFEWPIATVEVECEKGFYVRSLARDLGTTLGTGGHCASIRRTAVGPFDIGEASDPEDLPNPIPIGIVIPTNTALDRLPSA